MLSGCDPSQSNSQIERVGAMIHGDAAAGVGADAAPVGEPLGHAARVLRAEGVERHQVDGADAAGVDDVADRAHRGRVLVVVDREEDAAALRAVSSTDSASRSEVASGFSHMTWRPRAMAAQAIGAWSLRRRGDVDEVELASRRPCSDCASS